MSETSLAYTTRPRTSAPFDPTTMAAIEHLVGRKIDVRIAAGKVLIEGMALTREHVQARARQEGWQG